MKKQLFSLLILLSFVFSISAQTVKPTESEKNLRTHVAYLASGELEGRRTGERGATMAAGYIANMFAQYKLKAGVSKAENGKATRSFLQPFPYVTGMEIGRDNFLRVIPETAAKENKMEAGVNWSPVGFSPNGYAAPAPLVFAGYGIVANEAQHDDYAALDAKDKIVLVFDSAPDAGNPHSPFSRFNLHAKAKIAQEKGAKALLLIAGENNFKDDKRAQLKYDQTMGETAIPVAVISRSHAAQLFGVADLAEIEKAVANRKDAPEAMRAKIKNFPKTTAQLKVDLVKKQAAEAYNVIGILEGNDPQLKNEAIVIGAHYDHLGKGGAGSLAVNSAEIHHGADDNASGVAAMLELARQFSQSKNNKRTIIFMAFGGEEEGLLGSKHYVNNPVFPLDKTVAMINLDMVGRLNEGKLTVGGIGTADEWRKMVEFKNLATPFVKNSSESQKLQSTRLIVENALREKGFQNIVVDTSANNISLKGTVPKGQLTLAVATAQEVAKGVIVNYLVESNDVPLNSSKENLFNFALQLNEDGFGPSDHASFYGKQIPVLFFFTGTHLDYHKPTDTAEKVNYDGLLKITKYVSEIVKSIDQNPNRPTYAVAKSANMGGRTGFNVSLGTVPSYAESNDGMTLDAVRDDSPAAKSGLKAGDKIIKLAGRDIRNVMDYTFVLGEMKAGEEYEVVVMRGAEKLTLKIVPAARK